MNIFGLTVTRAKETLPAPANLAPATLSSPPTYGGWVGWATSLVREPFAGAWQRNLEVNRADVLTYSTVWACVTLIAGDIGKLWIDLVEEDEDGVCTPTTNPAYSPVLRKPNHFSTRVKFFEYWMISKLTTGNTYALKERDGRGVVTALYILDPQRVQVLVAEDGAVYYQLATDYLSGLDTTSVTVPASEIIHDICVPLYHPLVGVSPIHACGLSAMQGLKILQNSTKFFANGSQPGGTLSAPGSISNEAAKRIEDFWAANYAGEQNIGKIVVLGDGLKYEPLAMTAHDAEVIQQLKLTDERICATFHVPGYMVGVGAPPPYTDIQSINLQYYTQALQNPIENLETLLDEGLELKSGFHVQFDLEALARMDGKTQMSTAKDGVMAGIYTPNEARARFDLTAKAGGDTPYLQQQMYSLAALNKRDQAAPAPTKKNGQTPPATPALPPAAAPPKAMKAVDDLDGEVLTHFVTGALLAELTSVDYSLIIDRDGMV